ARFMAAHPDIEIPIFGNGDVDSPQKAELMREQYPDVSGIMIGRGSIGNPWIFNQIKHYLATGEELPKPSLGIRVETCRRHLDMSVAWKGEIVGIREMRRHYPAYFRGLPGFKPLRMKLVTTDQLLEIHETLDYIENEYDPEAISVPAESERKKPKLKIRQGTAVRNKLNLPQASAQPVSFESLC
ncbi:MAG: tRNA-dihydrouridine synthase, partial [Bacteroidota bacterium]